MGKIQEPLAPNKYSKSTNAKSKMMGLLADRAEARASQWYPFILPELPEPEILGEIVLVGSYSYSLPQTRRRLMRGVIELREGVLETPTSIARDYLRLKYNRGPIIKRDQFLMCKDALDPYPNFASPTKYSHGVYVDIVSAYWSIMEVVGWNIDYYPGRWIGPGVAPSDFPFANKKVCRNCLVSSGASGTISRYIPNDKWDEIAPGNSLGNPGLIKLISDILNSIAHQAIGAGAVYANTDGFIAPSLEIAAEIIGIIEDWGLSAHIKSEGPGGVKSSGAYAVGQDKSIPYQLRLANQPVKRLYPPHYIDWLQKTFSYWAANKHIDD